jgi:NAD(P)-dependent dehydrogenase (short-subunit alcohol dehydrogenase family)
MADRRVALVTGGTRGLGRAITERLVADGWSVLATYRSDHDSAHRLTSMLPGLGVARGDVALTADCERVVAEAIDRFGQLDHLVCAGAIAAESPVADMSDEAWDSVVTTNLGGTFRTIRAALTPITASPRGRIVVLSSVAATMGSAGRASYAASKAGLLGLVKTVAAEVAATGTTVNLVIPGPTVDTGMHDATDPAFNAAIARRIPLHRLGRPEETAHIVRSLLDDLAGFTTGASVTVDGGLSM